MKAKKTKLANSASQKTKTKKKKLSQPQKQKASKSNSNDKQWQADLRVLRFWLKKDKNYQPKLKLLPWSSKTKEGKQTVTRFYLQKLIKLIENSQQKELLIKQAQKIFANPEVDVKALIKFLQINSKPRKTNLDLATSQVFQHIAHKLSLLTQQLNPEITKLSKKTSAKETTAPDLKINVRLTSQKSKGNVNQATVKTLTITWKDNQKYEDFIRYHISNEKVS